MKTANSGNGHVRDIVTVTGEATRLCLAEFAELILAVNADGRSAAHALQENAMVFEKLRKLALPFGIGPAETQVAVLGLQPFYPALQSPASPAPVPAAFPGIAPGSQQTPSTEGTSAPVYRVSSLVRMSLHDLNRVGEFMDALARAGALSGGGLAFRVRDDSPIRRCLFEEAFRNARVKAEALACAAGRQLGSPISVVEQGGADPVSQASGARESVINARVGVQFEMR